jgi:CubicO group peptidase (beta-lactamase class C family)
MASRTEPQVALQDILDGFVDRGIVGAGLTVVRRGGERLVPCAGLAARARRIAVGSDRLFKIGGRTMTFVAATLLSLVQDGAVALDAPACPRNGNEIRVLPSRSAQGPHAAPRAAAGTGG